MTIEAKINSAVDAANKVIELSHSQPGLITQVFDSAFHNGSRSRNPLESAITSVGMAYNLGTLEIRSATPRWMSRKGLIRQAKDMSSSKVWKSLVELENEGKKHRAITPFIIAVNNSRLLTTAIVLGEFAAAIGPDVTRIVRTNNLGHFTELAESVGSQYPGPANDIDDFMDRLKSLVPNPHRADSKGEGTLFNYFLTYKAFKGRGDYSCPAVKLTHQMLEQWGRQLDTDPVYLERFRKEISRR
ncbi:MAG TPA: hypothetical protein VM077_03225 [Candidatus Limnocylindrales bacterium]|nr:hypothetical protein [Candidatus Limnocylindrales bacterium]